MKKLLFTMLLMAVGSVMVMARSDIKVVRGDKKFLKTAQGNATLVFDWEGATYDNKMPLASKFDKLEELKKVAWNGFQENFNKKSKKVKVVTDQEKARYKFTMKVTNMDQYVKVMGFIPGPATKVWGTMTITDLADGEVIAVIEVNEVDGGANPSPSGTFIDSR